MDMAYLWACELFLPLQLPKGLENVNNRTKSVNNFHSCMNKEIKKDKARGFKLQEVNALHPKAF